MIRRIDEAMFIEAFDDMNRGDNFTRPARRALFEYLEQMEEDSGENEYELDVIALCVEFSEHDEEELMREHGEEGQTLEDLLDDLRDQTTVIEVEHYDAEPTYIIGEY